MIRNLLIKEIYYYYYYYISIIRIIRPSIILSINYIINNYFNLFIIYNFLK